MKSNVYSMFTKPKKKIIKEKKAKQNILSSLNFFSNMDIKTNKQIKLLYQAGVVT